MRALFAATLLVGVSLPAFAQGPDDLWETQSTMEMAGMQMPGRTQKICKPKGQVEQAAAPVDDKCKLVDSKRSGNKMTFKVACDDGKNQYTGEGESEIVGPDSYRGKMHMAGKMEGRDMEMSMSYSGKKIGNCKYEDPTIKSKQMMAEYEKSTAAECKKAAEALNAQMFAPEVQMCQKFKPELCERANKVAGGMRNVEGYRAQTKASGDWKGAFKMCSVDLAAVTKDACKSALGKKDWEFVAETCPDDAKPLAKQHCEGRDYTAMMESEYRNICARFARKARKGAEHADGGEPASPAAPVSGQSGSTQGANAPAGETPAGSTTEPAQKPSATDAIKQGADKLKKFLKF